jgi:peptidoglycan/LPS O-acetylase OafA/YrhL
MPFLGILGLLKRRAHPWLLGTLAAWTLAGAWLLLAGPVPPAERSRWTRAYFVGIVLGLLFLAIDKLRRKRAVARWLKIALALLTIAAFVKALMLFAAAYVEPTG